MYDERDSGSSDKENNRNNKSNGGSIPKIQPRNGKSKVLFGSLFQNLVDMPLMKMCASLSVFTATAVVAFACVYYVFAREQFEPPNATFEVLLLYSLSITTTLGDSPAQPKEMRAYLLANAHAFAVQMLLVYISGVVFTRLTLPSISMTLSKRILFGAIDDQGNDGQRVLLMRLFFDDFDHELIDVKFQVTFYRMHTPTFHKSSVLNLVRDETPVLRIGTQIAHILDEDSPANMPFEELVKKNARFLVTVLGTEKSTMQTVFFKQMYEMKPDLDYAAPICLKDGESGQIVDASSGLKFHDLVERSDGDDNVRHINFAHLNTVQMTDANQKAKKC